MNIQRLLAGAVLGAALAGCASLGDPSALKGLNTIALVGVTANNQLYYVGENPPALDLMNAALNAGANQGDTNDFASIALGRTEALFAKSVTRLEERLATLLKTGAAVTGTEAYKAAPAEGGANVVQLIGAGYKVVPMNALALLATSLEADAVATVQFTFQKELRAGFLGTGKLGAYVTLLFTVYNRAGERIFEKAFAAQSPETVDVLANVFDGRSYAAQNELAVEAVLTQVLSQF